jgi:NAD(P)-dependent dehydrogenase (short-subunit alcohol dehydrogenase family)
LERLIRRFVCVVTGAGSKKGVGRSSVFELAAHGVACVYACDIDDSNFDELTAECKEEYPNTEVDCRGMRLNQIIGYQYDTTSEENTLMLIDDILNLWGRLDIWVAVNSAFRKTN